MHALEWLLTEKFFFMGCLNIYMKYIYFRVDIRENRKNSKKLKKKLTYNNVFVNDRHDFQNYCVWIVVHVHLLPRFKFNQDKKNCNSVRFRQF